jgi:hypothetical protein
MIGNALFALLIIVNSKTDTTIRWSDTTRLSYADFAGAQVPLKDSVGKLDTLAVINAEIAYRIDISGGKNRIHAYAVVYPEHSWMKVRTPSILKHEQGHFDIAEIYARRFEKKINDTVINDVQDFIVFLTDSFKDMVPELNAAQKKYDDWTQNELGRDYFYPWIHAQLYPSNKSDSLMPSPF